MPIKIHGNDYHTVAERVAEFHEKYPKGQITTELLYADEKYVRVKATATVEDRSFTGLAEEVRGSTNINKTSALENCETSAVGRALGFLGIGSVESIASADEVAGAIAQQKPKKTYPPKNFPNKAVPPDVNGEPF